MSEEPKTMSENKDKDKTIIRAAGDKTGYHVEITEGSFLPASCLISMIYRNYLNKTYGNGIRTEDALADACTGTAANAGAMILDTMALMAKDLSRDTEFSSDEAYQCLLAFLELTLKKEGKAHAPKDGGENPNNY